MPDLNAYDLEAAKLQVVGTARSMGIKVAASSARGSLSEFRAPLPPSSTLPDTSPA